MQYLLKSLKTLIKGNKLDLILMGIVIMSVTIIIIMITTKQHVVDSTTNIIVLNIGSEITNVNISHGVNMKDNSRNLIQEQVYVVREDIKSIVKENIEGAVEFYTRFTKSEDVSRAIIEVSLSRDVPVNLSFSVSFNESSFDPKAVNTANSNGSSDWGLFQLNNYYHKLTKEELFNIKTNSNRGIDFIRDMLERNDGDVERAIMCYNAGYNRINVDNIIPERAKNYAEKVIEYEKMLDEEFNVWLSNLNI